MILAEFIERIISDGTAAAKRDYAGPEDAPKLQGSIEGFEECRGKTPEQLLALYGGAREATRRARQRAFANDAAEKDRDEYWRWRCRELEIHWVLNCISAVLVNGKKRPLVAPTARAALKAAEVLAVG